MVAKAASCYAGIPQEHQFVSQLIQLLTNDLVDAVENSLGVWAPATQCGRPVGSSWPLILAWPSPGHCHQCMEEFSDFQINK